MTKVFNGRFTATSDEQFVVFLIGMRINKWWLPHKWIPVAGAMAPMMKSLYTHPETGFLHAEYFLYPGGIAALQYWRSFADLEHFARAPSDAHVGPWQRFNQAVGADGSVGIWHETYLIQPDGFECFYGNMPRFGLGAAKGHIPATGARETARLRLGKNKQIG